MGLGQTETWDPMKLDIYIFPVCDFYENGFVKIFTIHHQNLPVVFCDVARSLHVDLKINSGEMKII